MLKLDRKDIGDVTVLALSGQFVPSPGDDSLHDAIQELLTEGRHKILLNMGELSWINSSGIGNLVSSFSTVKRAGGKMKISQLSRQVQSIVTITKLASVLEVYPSDEEALSGFREAGEGH